MIFQDPNKVLRFRQNVAGNALAPDKSRRFCTDPQTSTSKPRNAKREIFNSFADASPATAPALLEHQLLAVVRYDPNALVQASFEAAHLLADGSEGI